MAITHKKEGGARTAPPSSETDWLELESEEHTGVERRLNPGRGADGCTGDVSRLEKVEVRSSEPEVDVLVDVLDALGVSDIKHVNTEAQMGFFGDVHYIVPVEVNRAS